MNPRSILRSFMVCALLLVLLWMAGCDSSEPRILSKSDDGSAVTLASEQDFSIQLASNPSTGYSWGVLDYDPAVLQLVGEPEYVSEANRQQRVGAGGWEVIRFRSVAAGQTQLKLGYRRPWETNVAPIETFTVDISVQ
jgi:inhibitor of cysteine peptidase